MSRKLWHPAFFQAIQLELEEYREVLEFESEFELSSGPLVIDVIIKKRRDVVIKKNIGQIFRTYNIVEYKSPTDYVSLRDYDKVQGYCRLYASQHNVRTEEMSVTLVSKHFPRKLCDYLAANSKIASVQPGIYFVENEAGPTQIIVSDELPETENLWLTHLTNQLTAERLRRVLYESERRKNGCEAYLHIVTETNPDVFKEIIMGKKLDAVMTELGYFNVHRPGKWKSEWHAEGLAEGEAKGLAEGEAKGLAEGHVLTILCVLKARFGDVSAKLQKKLGKITDLKQLEKIAGWAALCASPAELEKRLKEGK